MARHKHLDTCEWDVKKNHPSQIKECWFHLYMSHLLVGVGRLRPSHCGLRGALLGGLAPYSEAADLPGLGLVPFVEVEVAKMPNSSNQTPIFSFSVYGTGQLMRLENSLQILVRIT
jgi:hypothetical protein